MPLVLHAYVTLKKPQEWMDAFDFAGGDVEGGEQGPGTTAPTRDSDGPGAA
ncbi:hypothetical protein RM704_06305 [Streptomyces sp. DSM 3412]|uniref:Uncharacterized protein n=1 Tax=Streptomyces gottesmaniae TaxID=3075518 RepID=A0ABU2YRY3_9ACTN|nr:hypothetical protein [Streptomyces sp. DSM 3412]MDT0567086.1 hypothetical protein [Streptomyces sp. DSM 3412]